ncbi:MAG: GNAT family N-acetyltransferase [Chloroflexi bacterium]|nr:GNAT family N-acetyltransferase [Chloroflexota bacterium]MDL1943013.1 GNAT family N-acetyltransferase [Chloroflexi bacterium CFX2]
MEISVRRITAEDRGEWFKMRRGIWPEAPDDYLNFDMDDILASDDDAVLMAFVDGTPAGMIEARLRDYGEGCETSPVGYIEGWFVYPEFRGKGIASRLAEAAEDWARSKGCTEMASDTWLDNEASIRAHLKQGYQEAERLIHFVKRL